MVTTDDPLRGRATQLLTLATVFWGLSFPVMKATGLIQQSLLATEESWFVASSMVAVRFGIAAVITWDGAGQPFAGSPGWRRGKGSVSGYARAWGCSCRSMGWHTPPHRSQPS